MKIDSNMSITKAKASKDKTRQDMTIHHYKFSRLSKIVVYTRWRYSRICTRGTPHYVPLYYLHVYKSKTDKDISHSHYMHCMYMSLMSYLYHSYATKEKEKVCVEIYLAHSDWCTILPVKFSNFHVYLFHQFITAYIIWFHF